MAHLCGYALIVIIPPRTTVMFMNISKQGMLVPQAIIVSFVIKLVPPGTLLEFTMFVITVTKNKDLMYIFLFRFG